MDEQSRPGYWAVIPASVRYDEKLPPNAKLLFGEISALADDSGSCRIGNQYFAELFNLSERTVSSLLKALAAGGYIALSQAKDQKTGLNQSRKIQLKVFTPCAHPVEENFYPPGKNFLPPMKKISSGSEREHSDSAPVRNNINNNLTGTTEPSYILPVQEKEKETRKEKDKEPRRAMTDEEIRQAWIAWIVEIGGDWTKDEKNSVFVSLMGFYAPRELRKKEPARTAAALAALGKRLIRYGQVPCTMVDMLERATTAGWKSVFPLGETQSEAQSEQEEVWL